MPADKYTSAFTNAIELTNFLPVADFECASKCYDIVYNAFLKFQHDVSDALIMLTTEQQSRMLLNMLKNFKYNYFFYVDEANYISKSEKIQYKRTLSLWSEFNGFKFGNGKNAEFNLSDDELLISKVTSVFFSFAQQTILAEYREIEGEEKALPWILDTKERIQYQSEWNKLERERKGLPPDTRTTIKKLENIFLEDIETPKSSLKEHISDELAAPIPWRYKLADFAETLYKLERKGAIDLKSYFEGGGKGTDLVRSISSLFAFPNDKSAATLNTYLSEIKKSLGRGPLDAGVLKAIGRIRGGRMDDVLPDESGPDIS